MGDDVTADNRGVALSPDRRPAVSRWARAVVEPPRARVSPVIVAEPRSAASLPFDRATAVTFDTEQALHHWLDSPARSAT